MIGPFIAALAALGTPASTGAAPPDVKTLAADFGARPNAESPSLSPDGKHLVYIAPGDGPLTMAVVMDLANGNTKIVTYADGKPLRLSDCGWSAADRLVCTLYGISKADGDRVSWTRLVAVNADGTHSLALGNKQAPYGMLNRFDGYVLDWMSGTDGKVLLVRGGGAEVVDTRTDKGEPVKPAVGGGITDGSGTVRITEVDDIHNDAMTGEVYYRYRLVDSDHWKSFSKTNSDGDGLMPVAVDGTRNVAYALQKLDGREALYTVALDGSMKTDLVYANPKVDVEGVETIGRHDRVIGLRYVTDRQQIVYFDPVYEKLAADLAKALPKLPDIQFVSASTDERKLLVFARSDVDPGHYYLLNRDSHSLTEVLALRPQLAGLTLAKQRSVSFQAADGTQIPGYLSLPPNSDGRNLPAIVMPHGGPASRDIWGFDWLVQFFVERGYAVLQPEFRGSTGYGDAFLANNGFRSWRTAIGDVTAAGHWLVAQGIADPQRLGIFGWSYGGYAALQSNVLDPHLFKAVVAVAPVTDLYRMKREAQDFVNHRLVEKFVGSGIETERGSPDHNADAFEAPVLMLHGDQDINVSVAESQAMDRALKKAGKRSQLVVYPGLDHQLEDSAARTDLLEKTDAFFRANLVDRTPSASVPAAP